MEGKEIQELQKLEELKNEVDINIINFIKNTS